MNIDAFLKHWSLRENPFVAEEARDDQVYLRIMTGGVAHPDFEKVFGNPAQPSTSVIFGEKGSGKTALRLLMEDRLKEHNQNKPEAKTWVVRYDEWNHLVDRVVGPAADKGIEAFGRMRLEDHMDKILSLIVTELLDSATRPDSSAAAKTVARQLRRASRQQRVDFAYLSLLYDQPTLSAPMQRWDRIRRLLRIRNLPTPTHCLYGAGVGLVLSIAAALAVFHFDVKTWWLLGLTAAAPLLTLGAAWIGLRQAWANRKRRRHLQQELRAVDHSPAALSRKLGDLPPRDLESLPLPKPGDLDSRYELQGRLLRVLNALGFVSITVLVDRVDEPVRVNGDAAKMRQLVWPLFSNKFLQQDHFGVKMLLPIELGYELKREDADFYRRARLDKQNMVERLEWTGVTLFDICNQRLTAVHTGEGTPTRLKDLFDSSVTSQDLVDALDQMKQPRDAFKFLYDVIQTHCQSVTDEAPVFEIPKLVLEQGRKRQAQRVNDLARGYAPA